MNPVGRLSPAALASSREIAKLRARLAIADETIRAIRNGEVDAVIGSGKKGPQVFTLEGAEHAYRVLIESMNEGALTLTANNMILYANRSFARMVQCPLEKIMGSCFRRFVSSADRASLRPLMKQAATTGAKLQVQLIAADGSCLPVQISIQELPKVVRQRVTYSVVVTDMTEARRSEAMLRALTHRIVQVQEAERANVALELHDNVTQLLLAGLFCSQALVAQLAACSGPVQAEAMKLRALLGHASTEVERISRDLRPSVLEHLGLVSVFRATGAEFTARTGMPVQLTCVELDGRLPADTELALYRIFQDALKTIEQHARTRRVTVNLSQSGDHVQLTIQDDGAGYNPDKLNGEKNGLGLLGMRERATYVGGTLTVKSARRSGTTIEVRIPLPVVVNVAADKTP